ncbi:MAG: hypothetical protein ACOCWR_05795 [Oceanidesulfovibrio sp.]
MHSIVPRQVRLHVARQGDGLGERRPEAGKNDHRSDYQGGTEPGVPDAMRAESENRDIHPVIVSGLAISGQRLSLKKHKPGTRRLYSPAEFG